MDRHRLGVGLVDTQVFGQYVVNRFSVQPIDPVLQERSVISHPDAQDVEPRRFVWPVRAHKGEATHRSTRIRAAMMIQVQDAAMRQGVAEDTTEDIGGKRPRTLNCLRCIELRRD